MRLRPRSRVVARLFADARVLFSFTTLVYALHSNLAIIGGGPVRNVDFRRGQRGIIVGNTNAADLAAAYRPAGGNGTAHVRVEPVTSAAATAR